jgi:DDE family transposase
MPVDAPWPPASRIGWAKNLARVDAGPTNQEPSELAADKGYHSRAVLKELDDGAWKTRIAEAKQPGFSRWHGDDEARAAVYANRSRLGSAVGKPSMRRRAEIVERSFAHNLDRGGMRRTWLRGRENVHKRYLVHVAGHNLRHPDAAVDRSGHPERGSCSGAGLSLVRLHRGGRGDHPCRRVPDGFAILAMAVLADPG